IAEPQVKFHRKVGVYDIAKNVTDNDLQGFISDVDNFPNTEADPTKLMDYISSRRFPLLARFFLASGEKVYENRQYILDKLGQTANGEKYFKVLMDSLQYVERKATDKREQPLYHHIPTTIEVGKKYFAQQPFKVSKPLE